MTPAERAQLQKAISRAAERREIREAIAASAVHGSIDRLLGEELIAAGSEVTAAWHEFRDIAAWLLEGNQRLRNSEARMVAAVAKFEELVPRR